MSTGGKIFKWLKMLAGIVAMLLAGFGFVEGLMQEYTEGGRRMNSPIWTLADDPVHYIGQLAIYAATFICGLWLVSGPWDGGKSQRSESD